MSKIPTSILGRGSRLLGMASKVALSELSSKVRFFEGEKEKLLGRIELAQDVVKTLSELKGASMKVGQLLSLDLGDYLPPELVKVLEKLHNDSTFLPFADIERILRTELGEKFTDVEAISREPIAAASIGQVHRARIAGKDVVLKIQYPGVADSIPSDLRLLEILLKQFLIIGRKTKVDVTGILREVEEVMTKEANYFYERDMHLLYRKQFANTPYLVPEIYPDYTTEKVLTQEFIRGETFSAWLASAPTIEARTFIADLLLKLYLEELFVQGLVQTDPNPANFLITSDTKIALLDFGATKVYSREFVESYRKIVIHSYHRREHELLAEAEKLGLLDPRESAEVKELFLSMMDFLVDPFRRDELFNFSDTNFFQRSKEMARALGLKASYTSPPRDLLFLHRKLGGLFAFLKKLDAGLNLSKYWADVEAQPVRK